MKKLSISLIYKGTEYKSETDEYTEKQEEDLIAIVEKTSQGEGRYFSFVRPDGTAMYFPSKILSKSIITINEHK